MIAGLSVMLALLAAHPQTPPVRVLFIGNSLTAANDLPAMIEAIAASAGLDGRVATHAVTRNDFGLPEHWDQGDARRAIRRGGWTHVVLQQGPSSLPESRVVLRDYAKRFAAEARAAGATVVFYGVWPPRSRLSFLDAVTGSYAAAAADVRGALVPVGDGWRRAWARIPSLALYGPDDFHPSRIGTFLGALMFFEYLTGRPLSDVPNPSASKQRALQHILLTDAEFDALKAAAAEANAAAAHPAASR